MGLKKSEGGGKGAVFFHINAKEGCFQQGSGANKVKFDQFTDLEGTLIAFKVDEDEYEGVKREQVRLILRDTEPGAPNQHVSFSLTNGGDASMFGLKLLGTLNAADVTKPLTIRPWFMGAGTKMGNGEVSQKDMTGVTVYQNGAKVTHVNYGVDAAGNVITKLPDLPKVKVGGKELADKTPWNDMIDPILDSLNGKLQPAPGEGQPADESVDIDEAAEAAAAAAQQPAQQAAAPVGGPAANRSTVRQRA
jgi:hypothetical protein